MKNFTAIDTPSIIKVSFEMFISSDLNIFATELLPSSKPISIMTKDIIKPETYSILPCPKGCSLSAGEPAILNPMNDITDEPASDKLLKASAVTDTAPESIPTKSLPINRQILSAMPKNDPK